MRTRTVKGAKATALASLAVFITALAAVPALAWNKPGHMVSGSIAGYGFYSVAAPVDR